METKPKPCKGVGKAISVKGCGTVTLWRRYGLCPDCLADFLFGTDAGKLIMQKSIIPKAKTANNKIKRQERKELKEKIKTRSDYERELQKEINTIVRLIDKGFVCISTGKPLNAKYDAGHMRSVGSNPALRFNLFNIYAQSVHANQYLSGDQINFMKGIEKHYGKDVLEKTMQLSIVYPYLKLPTETIKEFTYKARSIVKWLKLQERTYDATERIELRERFNKEIGIYG